MNIRVAILAAGKASRYGSNKLLATDPAKDKAKPLLLHVISQYQHANLDDIHILTGYWHEELASVIQGNLPLHYVAQWQEGIAASLRQAAGLVENEHDGLCIALGDQAGITVEHLHRLIAKFNQQSIITATECDGIICPPVIFPKRNVDLLMLLEGDYGAGKYLRTLADSQPESIQIVKINTLVDIDSPLDWQKIELK